MAIRLLRIISLAGSSTLVQPWRYTNAASAASGTLSQGLTQSWLGTTLPVDTVRSPCVRVWLSWIGSWPAM